jgi:hypothetical protein
VAEEDISDDELLAELEAYEMEQRELVIREEPRGQEVWWGGIFEPLRETPLEPEPVEILGDLIQFEKDPALVPDDVFESLEKELQTKGELSLLLEEFANEKDWECSDEEALVLPYGDLREGKQHPVYAELSAPEKGETSIGKPVAERNEPQSPASCPTHGWELISSGQITGRVLRRLAYVRRFINSCRRKFRPMSRELSTVEVDLARKQLDKLRGQEGSLWGESSVGWRRDLLQ